MRRFISILVAVLMVLTLLPLDRVILAADTGESTEVGNNGENVTPQGDTGTPNPSEGEDAKAKENAKKALDGKIKEAEATLKDVIVSDKAESEVEKGKKFVAVESDKTALTEAIKTAKAALEKTDATADSYKQATDALNTALTTFNGKVKTGTKEDANKKALEEAKKALTDEIAKANKALEGIEVSDKKAEEVEKDKKFVTTADKETLTKAITAAETASKKENATADELNQAKTALTTAIDTFNKAVKTGTKENKKPEKTPEEEKKEAKAALDESIKKAEELQKKEEYKKLSAEEKKPLEDALTAAKAITDKSSKEDIDKVNKALTDAIGKVNEKLAPKDDKKDARDALKKSIDEAKKAKESDKYKNATSSKKLALDNALTLAESTYKDEKLSADTVKEVKKSLDAAVEALDGKATPKPDYTTRVPKAVKDTIEKAKAFKNCLGYSAASYSSRYTFESALADLEVIANRFENGYYGRYYNGYYDRYYNGYYYVDGVPYTYYEFYNKFGYYPDRYYRYGYNGYRYRYYGTDIRDAVEKVVDNIRSIALEVGPYYSCTYAYRNLAYPSYSAYEGYYDYDYPWYDGYYYDRTSVSELKKLIGVAEELAYSRKDEAWKTYKNDLVDAAAYGRKAVQGRASVRDAINELEKAIKKAKNEGMKIYIRRAYMKGVDANHFAPNQGLTRAEMAQILANVLIQSGNKVAYSPKSFKDVPSNVWYKKAVDLVSTYNIMIGNPDGTFKPQDKVSIEELIVMAARVGGHTPRNGNVFGIVNHKWSVPYIQTAYANNWIGIDRFNPSDAISRGKATQVLNRAMNYGVDKEFINKHAARMNKFADVNSSNPYYYDILAATNTISYQQAPKSNMRYWRAFEDNGKWTDSKYSKGTFVEPYTGW